MSIEVRLELTFHVEGPMDASGLADSARKVMEALLALEECNSELSDAGVAMDANEMNVQVELAVTGGSEPECVERALAAVRTAIHAAGHGTPDWPSSSPLYATPDLGEPEGVAGTFRRLQFLANAD